MLKMIIDIARVLTFDAARVGRVRQVFTPALTRVTVTNHFVKPPRVNGSMQILQLQEDLGKVLR